MTKHETKFMNAYRIEAREVRKVSYTVEGATLAEAIAKFSQENPQAIDVTSIVCVGAAVEMLKPVDAPVLVKKKLGRPKGKKSRAYSKGVYHSKNPIPDTVVAEIRKLAPTSTLRELAVAYGISMGTVSNIIGYRSRYKDKAVA